MAAVLMVEDGRITSEEGGAYLREAGDDIIHA